SMITARITVDTNKMGEYDSVHKRTTDELAENVTVEAKYDVESGLLRFDSPEVPEFWIEVNIRNLIAQSKKRKAEQRPDDEDMMPWSKMEVDDAVLTLWPGTAVRNKDMHGPKGIPMFFRKAFGIDVIPVGCVETLPDKNEFGEDVEDTGGRSDFFFFVKVEDVPKFAIKRFQFGMRWWSDVYFNGQEDIYPDAFRAAYPDM
ncbi:MAG: hypothetical protein VX998_07400, partial [Candidatus Thermoplasmatota archaeon]|nr:hypothetical protein [Candidatus Thermoplasmatota archaeon]